jgi:signal transduction histidine kinase
VEAPSPPSVNPHADARPGLAGYVESVLRSLVEDRSRAVAPGALDVPPILVAIRIIVLVAVLVTVPLAEPHLGAGARGTAVAVALGICIVSWLVWLFAGGRMRVVIAALAVLGVAGGALAALSPLSTAIAVGCVVTAAVGARLNVEISLAITAATVAAFLAAGLATGTPTEALLGYPLTFIGLWALGLNRHAYLLRAEQAEQTLAETRRAREAETEAAALGERARIAREIHDVLAHSLAAVSVNLEAAEALLGTLPTGSPELGKAIECISRASVFTREGLADARRAVLALRDDAAPLSEQLAELVKEYGADDEVPADLVVTGSPRPVSSEASLAVYRTAQEALTTARKHAPGQPVRVGLEYSAAEIVLRVVNPLPDPTANRPLAASGAGYGLTGLRERAALGGGTLTAGPADEEWQVTLRIPA